MPIVILRGVTGNIYLDLELHLCCCAVIASFDCHTRLERTKVLCLVIDVLCTRREEVKNEHMAHSTGLTIIRQPQPWGAKRDEKVTLTVAALSENNLAFEWKLNGKTIGQGHEIKQEEKQSPVVKISTIQMKFSPTKHAGEYECVIMDKKKDESLSSNKVELRDFDHDLKTMQAISQKNELLIVFIGRAGTGKSSLFNSLVGKKVVEEGHTCDSVTESVIDQTHVINGIKVRLVDTPGFGLLGGKPTTVIMEEIAKKLQCQDVNLLIYCTSMALDSRLNTTDGNIAVELSKTYRKKSWENTLVALTFACGHKQKEEIDPAKATEFNKVVTNYTEKVRTKLLTDHGGVSTEVADAIPILPVGYFDCKQSKSQQECCTLPDGSNWLSNLWYQSLLRIRDPHARYAFYQATFNIHPYLRENEHRELIQEY